MRRHDQPVELLVGGVGEREDGPVAAGMLVLRFHLDASHDAVGAGRGGDLEIVALVAVDLDGAGEIERHVVPRDLDGLDGASRQHSEQAEQYDEKDQPFGVKSSH